MKTIKHFIVLVVLVAFSVSAFALVSGNEIEAASLDYLSLPSMALVFGSLLLILGRSDSQKADTI